MTSPNLPRMKRTREDMKTPVKKEYMGYVVKNKDGLYWNGKTWARCLRCALRMNEAAAHRMAHTHEYDSQLRVIPVKDRGVDT